MHWGVPDFDFCRGWAGSGLVWFSGLCGSGGALSRGVDFLCAACFGAGVLFFFVGEKFYFSLSLFGLGV